MKLSIISAVKGRPELTKLAFETMWNKCSDVNNIEHIIAYDCDDYKLINYFKNDYKLFAEKKGVTGQIRLHKVCFCHTRPLYPLRKISVHYWNTLTKISTGDIIFGLCNDCIIETDNYDKEFFSAYQDNMKLYGHSCFQFLVDDDRDSDIAPRDEEFCSWLILSKNAAKVFNTGIMPDEFSSASADRYVYKVFHNTYIKSQIDLFDKIKTKHICYHNGSYPKDSISINYPVEDQFRTDYKEAQQRLYSDNYYNLTLDNMIMKEILCNTKKE